MPAAESAPEEWSFLRPPLEAGDLASLGGYRILSLIGQGAMGFVFKAEDTALRRPVALKVMRPAIAATPLARDRLLREARAAAGLRNECVVTIHQVGEDRGIPYIAMEFLEGMTLEEWMARRPGPAPVETVRAMGRDLLRGLAAAHGNGLVHRDIKPANLWVDPGPGRLKVLDFGLTRDTGSQEQLTLDGAIMGTPAYMAPEQAAGRVADCRADLFSAGTVLYHLATDSSPFLRDGLLATLSAVCNHQPLPVLSVRPDLPTSLAAFIERLMSKDPDQRPADGGSALAEWDSLDLAAGRLQVPWDGTATLPALPSLEPRGASATGDTRLAGRAMPSQPECLAGQEARPGPVRKLIPWQTLTGVAGVAAALVLAVVGWALAPRAKPGPAERGDREPAVVPVPPDANSPAPAPETRAAGGGAFRGASTPADQPGRPDANRAPERFTNTLGMDLVLVKPGRFRLGGTGGARFRKPVELPAEFYIGAREVTQAQWARLTGEQPSHFSRRGPGADAVAGETGEALDRFPVESVTWNQARAFLARLNAEEPNPGWEYRLPSEAEWEYACRGGHLMGPEEDLMDYYGFTPSLEAGSQTGNLGDPMGRPKPAGSLGPNRLGLFDMHGNVAEWCADPHPDPAKAGERIIKGGSWASPPGDGRAGATFTTAERAATWALGFRVVLGRKAD